MKRVFALSLLALSFCGPAFAGDVVGHALKDTGKGVEVVGKDTGKAATVVGKDTGKAAVVAGKAGKTAAKTTSKIARKLF
jgi:hypothetical protein